MDRLSLLRPTAVVRVSVLPAASCGAFPLLPLLDRMIIAGTEICGNVKSPNSLHEALFFGLYSKLLAFRLERGKSLLHIEVRTDRVDDPIFKNFQAAAKSLLDYGAKIQTVTGFERRPICLLVPHLETVSLLHCETASCRVGNRGPNPALAHWQHRSPRHVDVVQQVSGPTRTPH